jgi:hypothetical protein
VLERCRNSKTSEGPTSSLGTQTSEVSLKIKVLLWCSCHDVFLTEHNIFLIIIGMGIHDVIDTEMVTNCTSLPPQPCH